MKKALDILSILITISFFGSIAALVYTILAIENPQTPTTAHDQTIMYISLLMFIICFVNSIYKFKK